MQLRIIRSADIVPFPRSRMYLPSSVTSPRLSSFDETIKYRMFAKKKKRENKRRKADSGKRRGRERGGGGGEGYRKNNNVATISVLARSVRARAPNYAIIQIAICVPRLFLVDPDARRVCRAPKCKSRHF